MCSAERLLEQVKTNIIDAKETRWMSRASPLITGAASGYRESVREDICKRRRCWPRTTRCQPRVRWMAVRDEIQAQQKGRSSKPCQVDVYVVDVTKEDQVNQAVTDMATRFGRLDYVVNAAGVAKKARRRRGVRRDPTTGSESWTSTSTARSTSCGQRRRSC